MPPAQKFSNLPQTRGNKADHEHEEENNPEVWVDSKACLSHSLVKAAVQSCCCFSSCVANRKTVIQHGTHIPIGVLLLLSLYHFSV